LKIRYFHFFAVLMIAFLAGLQTSVSAQESPVPVQDGIKSAEEKSRVPSLTQDELRELVRRVAENDIANDQKSRNYTYIEHVVERKLDGNGAVKSTESKTYEVMQLYGEQVNRLMAKDDKPLSEKDAAKEEEKIQKLIKKRSGESEDERKKRLEKEAKDREKARQFVREICDAYDMKVAGVENVDGRELLIIDGDPRPGYKPKLKDAKYLPKFRVRGWIDRATEQWVKLDADAIDNISWGAFLVKINKGMRLEIAQTLVNNEVWLPQRVQVKLGGRALFKSLNMEIDVTYRNYRKFRTDVRISGPIAVSPEK
jgi:hypothetical protein